MKIDFVSDIACPWCAVGLNALERALERLGSAIPIDLAFQPFELNPTLGESGADAAEYLKAKYGLNDEQLARNRETLRQRGAAVGFEFGDRVRIWNTFDAHRLLHWAGLNGRQRELKHALLRAYHGQGRNPGAHEVLVELAAEVGLDADEARQVLQQGRYTDEVRQAEARWQELGIHSVPSVVIDGRHLIQGGQPPEVFEAALRQLGSQPT